MMLTLRKKTQVVHTAIAVLIIWATPFQLCKRGNENTVSFLYCGHQAVNANLETRRLCGYGQMSGSIQKFICIYACCMAHALPSYVSLQCLYIYAFPLLFMNGGQSYRQLYVPMEILQSFCGFSVLYYCMFLEVFVCGSCGQELYRVYNTK